MNRITIDVSKDEMDFIREAVAQKYLNLMSYLDTCEEESKKAPTMSEIGNIAHTLLVDEIKKSAPKVTLNAGRVRAMKEAGVWKSKAKRGKIIAAYAKKDAPYGYKKDGTPKKQPGRKKVAA